MALHAKAKAEAGYRFYALYDKIGREDILAHAYAQCRSNKGAPGVDGQDFADIEAYGVERWLAELALALILTPHSRRPTKARLQGHGEAPLFPRRRAFANPEIYEFLEAEGMGYAIRLPANHVLQAESRGS